MKIMLMMTGRLKVGDTDAILKLKPVYFMQSRVKYFVSFPSSNVNDADAGSNGCNKRKF